MADTSAVDAALVAKLLADSTLMATMTGGVYFDEAPQGSDKFVIVSQMTHEDVYDERGSAYEVILYLVKAVATSTSGADVKTAASRIHTILQDGTLSPSGYSLMNMRRTERIRMTEVDDESDRRWQHRGGVYETWVQP